MCSRLCCCNDLERLHVDSNRFAQVPVQRLREVGAEYGPDRDRDQAAVGPQRRLEVGGQATCGRCRPKSGWRRSGTLALGVDDHPQPVGLQVVEGVRRRSRSRWSVVAQEPSQLGFRLDVAHFGRAAALQPTEGVQEKQGLVWGPLTAP